MRLRRFREARTDPVVAALRRAPVLASVGERDLRRLAADGRVARFREGEVVVSEGGTDRAFFVLLSGCAAVSVGGRLRGSLHPGECFGEIAAVCGRFRTATVVAVTDLECLAVTSQRLRGFLGAHSGVAAALARQVAGYAARPGPRDPRVS